MGGLIQSGSAADLPGAQGNLGVHEPRCLEALTLAEGLSRDDLLHKLTMSRQGLQQIVFSVHWNTLCLVLRNNRKGVLHTRLLPCCLDSDVSYPRF